jgi:hypothetical protein
MTTKNTVECTCPECGQTLRVACPNCTTTDQRAPRAAGQRTDLVTALLVDAVISASAAEGTAYAARTLCENGVPFDVALRVLTRPWHRRYHPVSQLYAQPADAPDVAAKAVFPH